MTRAAILALVCLVGAKVASADDSFEARARGAQRVRHVEDLVWALTAPCDHGDEVEQRQCRRLRDERAQQLGGAVMLVDADPDAFSVGHWNPRNKSIPVTLTSCVRCAPAGMVIDGRPWFVTGSPPRVEGGRVRAGTVYDSTRLFSDEASAVAWAKSVASVRVQLLVKVPDKHRWLVSGRDGLLLEVVGFRVASACDGSIVISNPPSSPVPADRKACGSGRAPAETGAGAAVDTLTPLMIQAAMKPVVDAANTCFEHFGVAGSAKLEISIASDGTVAKYDQTGDFEGTPTGTCIDDAMRDVQFPASNKPRTKIGYPIVLR